MRAASRSTGFSQNTALPAETACSIRSAWVSVGVQISTASMAASARIASALVALAPEAAASEVAASGIASVTATSWASPRAATFSPWMRPMRPAPSNPIFMAFVIPVVAFSSGSLAAPAPR